MLGEVKVFDVEVLIHKNFKLLKNPNENVLQKKSESVASSPLPSSAR